VLTLQGIAVGGIWVKSPAYKRFPSWNAPASDEDASCRHRTRAQGPKPGRDRQQAGPNAEALLELNTEDLAQPGPSAPLCCRRFPPACLVALEILFAYRVPNQGSYGLFGMVLRAAL
jgi:hypothetical protein